MMSSSPWLVDASEDDGAELRLVCFPHAGGGASSYHPWRAGLRPRIRLTAVQLPGRENRLREPLIHSLQEIVDAVAPLIVALDDLPVVLFGHSMGALVAYEVARRMRRDDGAGPLALLVSGRGAPHLEGRAPRIAHLPAAEVLRLSAGSYGGIPAAILRDRQLVEVMGGALKADLAIVEQYESKLQAPLDCPISAFGGDEDPWVSRGELDAWAHHTRARFASTQFPGGHFYFRTPEVQQALLARIRATAPSTPTSDA